MSVSRNRAGLLWAVLVLTLPCLSQCVPSPIYKSQEKAPSRPAKSGQGQASARPANGSSVDPARRPASAHPVDVDGLDTSNAYQIGVASYYGKKFHKRPTANGEIFNMYKLTAAHRVLPLGTIVRVTNLSNGRWVEVKVNDRGPFIEGRILDLSFAAALELEMVEAGTTKVMIEILKTAN